MPASESGAPGPVRDSRSPLLASPHFKPLALLTALVLVFWSKVLVTGQVLLPGEMLSGFLPFGGNSRAPWSILQWDSLAQYYPWRDYAARSLHAGHIPLWNPYQFTGTPFLANLQSAVFYPLNFPFWLLDPAYAFGVSACLHSLLAAISTYFLARRWGMRAAGACLAGVAYAFCGYLSAWAMLPTLAATAAWLPLCLLLLEKAAHSLRPVKTGVALAAALTCALLAGHAQIFFYLLLALALRIPFLGRKWIKGVVLLDLTVAAALLLGSVQLLPTLELAKLGHRAGDRPSASAWNSVQLRALQPVELPGLALPTTQPLTGSLSENFGYMGLGAILLSAFGLAALALRKKDSPLPSGAVFAAVLALFGLLYACATPVAKLFFFYIPGISQMGGTGRVLLLWSFGIALLAGLGLDWVRSRVSSPVITGAACLFVLAELFTYAFLKQPIAPRASIYPATDLTTFLQKRTSPTARALFYTPKNLWLPEEGFRPPRNHPPGVLPPNGATVYGIYDVNGYDSLSPASYRKYIATAETDGPSPPLNGNMVLLNNLADDALLDELSVLYVVAPPDVNVPNAQNVLTANGCTVWQRTIQPGGSHVGEAAFYPGWKDGHYQPESFRLGGFLTMAGLLLTSLLLGASFARPKKLEPLQQSDV